MKGKSYQQLVAWMFGDRKVLPMVAEVKEHDRHSAVFNNGCGVSGGREEVAGLVEKRIP